MHKSRGTDFYKSASATPNVAERSIICDGDNFFPLSSLTTNILDTYCSSCLLAVLYFFLGRNIKLKWLKAHVLLTTLENPHFRLVRRVYWIYNASTYINLVLNFGDGTRVIFWQHDGPDKVNCVGWSLKVQSIASFFHKANFAMCLIDTCDKWDLQDIKVLFLFSCYK